MQAGKVLEVIRGAPAEEARALQNPPSPPQNRYSNNGSQCNNDEGSCNKQTCLPADAGCLLQLLPMSATM